VWVAGAAWGVALALSFTPAWRTVELAGFDWLTITGQPPQADLPIVIVGIDEPSFGELRMQWPWPRHFHARLIDSLREAGAAAIGFDVVFPEPSQLPSDDQRLAEAVGRAGNVVLAAEEAVHETAYEQRKIRVEPLPELVSAGGAVGFIGVSLDRDSVVRRLPPARNVFWRRVLDVYGQRVSLPPLPDVRPGDLIRFRGPGWPFRYASYYQALDPVSFLPRDFFKDRMVLVGLAVKPSPELETRQADLFITPLWAWEGREGRLTPGVEVQAQMVATVLDRRVVREVPEALVLVVMVAVAICITWLMRPWQPLRSGARCLGLAAGVAGSSFVLFRYFDRWLPGAAILLGLALAYVGEGGLSFLREQALRRRIREAFSHYVSPHLVEEMIAHPDRLRLGGERRVLTILFSDLAGFTTLAERLSPEEVVRLLNRYLTEVAQVVIDSGGTVDKFLGDGVMAFWNAPLEDPDHALHACRAAVAMQAAIARLRGEFVQSGGTAIHMRVGIHTGSVIVGNMGSQTRFDYTAAGDDVNLTSRLEGANKVYGTDILLSETTAAAVVARFPLRHVDRVRVKGRTQAVEIFTVAAEPALDTINEEAIDAYRKADWDGAHRLWAEIARRCPNDGIAAVYLERIATFRRVPPSPGWDGSVSLQEK